MITNFRKLEFDSNLFGYNVGVANVEKSCINEILDFKQAMKKEHFKVIYLYPLDIPSEKIIEELGIRCVDQKYRYTKKGLRTYENIPNAIRSYSHEYCSERLLQLVLQSGEYSRFKTDKNFDKQEFEKLYQIWIEKSIKKENATDILVYYIDNIEVGILIYQFKGNICHLTIIAVDKDYRNMKIGKQLYQSLENNCMKKEINEIEVYTQGTNKTACLFYEDNGFSLNNIEKIYHLWIK